MYLICLYFLECFCDFCLSYWIGFGNSCYYYFSEFKIWLESYVVCVKLNFYFLKIDINEELVG